MTLVGRLADTPEVQTTNSGLEVLRYAVGTSMGRGENQKTSWFKVSCFMQSSKQRDYFASLEKGTLVYVEGEATMNQYQDSEGKTRSALNISQKRLEVLAHNRKSETSELGESSELIE
ncbi:hypothetical protein K3495_g8670 [Podosphaera aphanis]|nr:hypothetical protein K3495_g8670 [Podosphaera aphanis]